MLKNKSLSVMIVCLILLLAALSLSAACAAPTPAPAPAPAPSPVPAPAPAPAPGPAQSIELKAVAIFPSYSESTTPMVAFVDKVNERGKGELVIDYIGGPETIGAFEQAKAVKGGVVDIAFVFAGAYTGMVPAIKTLAITNITPQQEREIGYYDFMVEEHEKAGLYFLGRSGWDMPEPGNKFFIFTNTRVETPYDLIGQKMAGLGTAADAFMKSLGMAHAVMAWGDIYTAIERGVVDGYWDGILGPVASGWMDALKYCVDQGFYNDNLVFLMNPDTWNSLSKDHQDLIMGAVIEVEQEMPAVYTERVAEDRAIMRDVGVEFIKFSPSDTEWFLNLAYDAEWEKQLQAHPEMTSKVKAMLEK